MKKKYHFKLSLYLIGFLVLLLSGCSKSEIKTNVTIDELNNVNDTIIEYFSKEEVKYKNLSFNYVDLENKVVVVGLINNSESEQLKFKKEVVNSNLLKFIQGAENINLPVYK